MNLFFDLLIKVIPLYLIIGIGYMAGRVFDVKKESVANLAIYILAPAVVFLGVIRAELNLSLFMIPVIAFVFSAVFEIFYFYVGKFLWKDNTNSLLAFAAAVGNTGYFGLPVILGVFGEKALPFTVMFILGAILFENTLGYYFFARAEHGVKEALNKLVKLPSLYAFALGLILNLAGIKFSTGPMKDTLELMKGAYAPLGMMMVGLGLLGAQIKHVDYKFIGIALFNKFIIWPALMFLVIFIDKTYFHLFDSLIRGVLLIESCVPIAANSVALATRFRAHPEKAAVTVMISNFAALIVIPLMLMWLAGRGFGR